MDYYPLSKYQDCLIRAVKTIRKIIPTDWFVFIDCIFTAYKPIHVPNVLHIYLLIGPTRVICAIFQGFRKNNKQQAGAFATGKYSGKRIGSRHAH